jgi:CRISPR-associated endonuclease/helicase Cas3
MNDERWSTALSEEERRQFGALWGKSGQSRFGVPGTVNLLVQHLFDTSAVGELVWDRYLAAGPKRRIDELAAGQGRRLLAWLCGIHDVGKASPAFQGQVPELAQAVDASGLVGAVASRRGQRWRHELAGGLVVRQTLQSIWKEDLEGEDWVWPIVAGHHGRFAGLREVGIPADNRRFGRRLHGDGTWDRARGALLDAVTAAVGSGSLADVKPLAVPGRADQLLLSGLVIMADWIASSDQFPGVPDLDEVSIAGARERARRAWGAAGLDGGWVGLPAPPDDVIRVRFDREARPVQAAAVEVARSMEGPGLVLIEAPTGEGKTEAALAAAEVLAHRFGANGVFVGLPTQATSDPMFSRVRAWLDTFDESSSVVLLHGRRRFNEEWQRLVRHRSTPATEEELGGDDLGMADDYGIGFADVGLDGGGEHDCGTEAAAEWFLGPKRGLLAPNAVGTIDQVLYAGTRTKHVMLRYAGLAGKVVVLDEVHAADVYMAQFLGEVLRWLGQGRIPVVLLSATLAPMQREQLVAAYEAGLLGTPAGDAAWTRELSGYPLITAVWARDGAGTARSHRVAPLRQPPTQVAVEALPESEDDADAPVTALLVEALAEGGCALVIRNTVRRAVATFDALLERFDRDEVVLLHARFSAADRARLTERLLRQLGQSGERPHRLVVVATQIAEQSFDVDADLLVTDLAPVDLLVQRAGRLHRHDGVARPAGLGSPRMVVTGFSEAESAGSGPPRFPRASETIYSRHLLLQTTAQVRAVVASGGWRLPTEVPALVAACYGEVLLSDCPDDAERARQEWDRELDVRAAAAGSHVLSATGQRSAPTLAGLHTGSARSVAEADEIVKVRDGDQGPEVVLVSYGDRGYSALDGTPLGPNGDRALEHLDEVLGGTIRVPATGRFASLAHAAGALSPLPAWRGDPWLGHLAVLVLDPHLTTVLDRFTIRYDPDRGLLVDPL